MKLKKMLAVVLALVLLVPTAALAENESPVTNGQNAFSDATNQKLIRMYAHYLADNYYYGVSDNDLLYSVICRNIEDKVFNLDNSVSAMIDALEDEYAQFYMPQDFTSFEENIGGSFAGIGVVITQNEKGAYITEVMNNTPAFYAGIRENDIIVKINGNPTAGMDVSGIKNLIVGEVGTKVTVTVLRGESEIEFECTRSDITVNHTYFEILEGNIAYIYLDQFTSNCAADIEKYVKEAESSGVKKMILDLRNNPGGDMDAAIEVANILIPSGKLVQMKYKDSKNDKYIYSTNRNATKMKKVVLVNENSASASEFITAAFQARGAATVIGTQTFGKGSMQSMVQMPTGAGFKYTVGEFYSLKGKRIHKVGITPDIVVENTFTPIDEASFEKIDFDEVDMGKDGGRMTLALEQRLVALGVMRQADEVFDEKTKEAVKEVQLTIGQDPTGIPGFYEYLFLNDISYDFDKENDLQLDRAIAYLGKK